MNGKLVISSSPHIRTIESVSVMIDVLVALFPVFLVAVLLLATGTVDHSHYHSFGHACRGHLYATGFVW